MMLIRNLKTAYLVPRSVRSDQKAMHTKIGTSFNLFEREVV